MSSASDFLDNVIRPALKAIGHDSPAAEQLLLGTAIQESHLKYRRQLGGGPGRGLFQMEPATHNDIWKNYLAYKKDLADKVSGLLSSSKADRLAELENNDKYAAAMARVHYLRQPAKLPEENDIQGMAAYWKKYYNTPAGKGKESQFIENWKRFVEDAPQAATEVTWPLVTNVIRGQSLSNTFGMVRKYANGNPKPHQGWDLAASVGTMVYAIAAGTVEFVQNQGDYGRQVCHSFAFKGKTYYAFYAHLSSTTVAKGQKIAVNDVIGKTGKTGNAVNLATSEDHLHFEIRTQVWCGTGLGGRVSPLQVFGICPLHTPVTAHD